MIPEKLELRAGAALALACAASCAYPQTPLQSVVVTASRTEQRVQDAFAATTLITREDIDEAQTPDLPTLLRRVPGVEITQNGGMGGVASVFIRGGEARHTLVLIDGVPINNLNFSLAALEHIPLSNVDRIEIVRGNVSSLYGSAALGGVIQIFTRRPTATPQATLTAQGGSRGLFEASASGGVKLASGTGLSATVDTLRDGGIDAIRQSEIPGTDPDRDGYRRRSASAAITQDIGEHRIGLKLRDSRGTVEYDSEFGPPTQRDASHFVEQGAALDGTFRLSQALKLDAAITRSTDKLDASVTAFPFFIDSESTGEQLGLEWRPAEGHTLTAGLEHQRQHVTSDTVYTSDSRDVDSARIGYVFRRGPHELQLNARRDRYSDFGSADTWLAAYGYDITEALRASVSASTGFNAPTFNDLYYPFGGNPLLKPERVRSYEAALRYAARGQEVRLTLFENRYRDLIANDAFFNRVNVGHARNTGVEVSYAGKLLGYGLQASLTSQDPKDVDTGMRLLRRARVLGNFAVSRDAGPWQWGGNLRFSGDRADRAGQVVAGYGVLDLTASYTVSPQVKVFGRVENALDRDYETAYGYRQPGRGVFVGVSWQPKVR
jgi:vitamin B12 transporter